MSSQSLRSGHRKKLVVISAALSLMGPMVPAAAAVHYVKVVNVTPGHVLWLHSGPGPTFEKIGFLPHGARHVRLYKCRHVVTRRWCQIRYRGTRGWASRHYLADDPTRIVRVPDRDAASRSARPREPASAGST